MGVRDQRLLTVHGQLYKLGCATRIPLTVVAIERTDGCRDRPTDENPVIRVCGGPRPMRSLAPLSVLLLVVHIAAALAVGLSAPLGLRGATVIVAAVLVAAAVACGALNARTVRS